MIVPPLRVALSYYYHIAVQKLTFFSDGLKKKVD